jgi:hypothetical protein
MGWCPVEAALALGTSVGTILSLEEGGLDEELRHRVIDKAHHIFLSHHLPIDPVESDSELQNQ